MADGAEEIVAVLLHGFGGVEVGGGGGEAVELLEGDAGLEERGGVRQRPESVIRGGDIVLPVALLDAAVGSGDLGSEEAGPVEVEEGGKRVAEKGVHERSEVTRDVGVAEPLADHAAVLALDQGVVVGVAGAGLGELTGVELGEQCRDAVVDVLGAVVGVEAFDLGKGKALMRASSWGTRKYSVTRRTAPRCWNCVTSSTTLTM